MSLEERDGRPGKVRSSAVQIVPARARVVANPEVRAVDGWLEVSLAAPDIPQGKFRYRIRKRYLLVWADGSQHGEHHFVILPHPVDPSAHEASFANGVVDVRIRLAAA